MLVRGLSFIKIITPQCRALSCSNCLLCQDLTAFCKWRFLIRDATGSSIFTVWWWQKCLNIFNKAEQREVRATVGIRPCVPMILCVSLARRDLVPERMMQENPVSLLESWKCNFYGELKPKRVTSDNSHCGRWLLVAAGGRVFQAERQASILFEVEASSSAGRPSVWQIWRIWTRNQELHLKPFWERVAGDYVPLQRRRC